MAIASDAGATPGYHHITVSPAIGSCGAEISGVDLSKPLADAVFEEILFAFHEWSVIWFRNQDLTPPQQAAFAERFGELDTYPFMAPVPEHPNVIPIVKERDAVINFGGGWHTDTSYKAVPPKITMLYAVDVPERGGDTLFSDTARAFAALSKGMQALFLPLTGIYSAAMVHGKGGAFAIAGDKQSEDYHRDNEFAEQEVEHPVIRTHPVTGRKAIYATVPHTARIKHMTTPESQVLINYLHQQAIKADYQTRLRWERGTLGLWDNRCVWHYALNDYQGERREMHRITVKGEVPI